MEVLLHMESIDAFVVDFDEAHQNNELVIDTFYQLNKDGKEDDKSVNEASSA